MSAPTQVTPATLVVVAVAAATSIVVSSVRL